MHAVTTQLQADELTSLRQLAGAMKKVSVCGHHGEKLIWSGFASLHIGALTITTMGRAKLIFETTRASWHLSAA